MDPTVKTVLLGILGGTSLSVGLLSFVLKRWIGIRIDESVKHEYACQFETVKGEIAKEREKFLQELQCERQKSEVKTATDLALFQDFLQTIPPGGTSYMFLRNCDMGGRIEWDKLVEVDEFLNKWDVPDHEFLELELENSRSELYRAVRRYMEFLNINSFSLDNDLKFSAIHPDSKGPDSEFWRAKVQEANKLANDVVECYDFFIRLGRNKLGC